MAAAGQRQRADSQQDRLQHAPIVSCAACNINRHRGGWRFGERQWFQLAKVRLTINRPFLLNPLRWLNWPTANRNRVATSDAEPYAFRRLASRA